jgi:hypothetical protein
LAALPPSRIGSTESVLVMTDSGGDDKRLPPSRRNSSRSDN